MGNCTMHLYRICALAAAAAVLSASAAMAATPVNIVDPNAASRAAHVEPGNRLAVQEVAPATFFHSGAILSSADACVPLATPPAGKALIVRQVRVNVHDIGAVGGNNTIFVYLGEFCNEVVGEVSPNAVGLVAITFDPGLVLPAGGTLSATAFGSPRADVNTDGYIVASSVAPAVGQTLQLSGRPSQR
jgi:hypothetical protein